MKSILHQSLDRFGTDSVKWDGLDSLFHLNDDVLPLWVADIDIRTAPSISEALASRAATGEFGYTMFSKEAQSAVSSWYTRRHGLNVTPEHVLFSSGVVPALTHIVEALTEEGDGIIIQSPVYPPFHGLVTQLNRRVLDASLERVDGRYEMNFDALEQQMRQAKLFLLCSPHNPVGRVWTETELKRVVDLARRHNVIVVSDEIHADLTYPSNRHTAIARLDDRAITVSAPSKAFNIAGLFASYIICSDDELRKQIRQVQMKYHIQPTPFANTALIASYTDRRAERWLDQLTTELEEQATYLVTRLRDELPQLTTYMPEASYLLWVDFDALGLEPEVRQKELQEQARLLLSQGLPFGQSGQSFERINFGTSRLVIDEALHRLKEYAAKKTFV